MKAYDARPAETTWERMMRFAPALVGSMLILATVSSAGYSRPSANQAPIINALSVSLAQRASGEQAAGRFESAIDLYEAALTADPRNRSAFVGLGQIARAQGFPGKAITMFRRALALSPNDQLALSEQGQAFVERGAISKAQATLATLRKLCSRTCTIEIAQVERAIQLGPPQPRIAADTSVTTNADGVVSDGSVPATPKP